MAYSHIPLYNNSIWAEERLKGVSKMDGRPTEDCKMAVCGGLFE